MMPIGKARGASLHRSRRPRHGNKSETAGTWDPRKPSKLRTWKGANNPKRVGNPWLAGVGPVHSRGKGGAMPAEPARALEGTGVSA